MKMKTQLKNILCTIKCFANVVVDKHKILKKKNIITIFFYLYICSHHLHRVNVVIRRVFQFLLNYFCLSTFVTVFYIVWVSVLYLYYKCLHTQLACTVIPYLRSSVPFRRFSCLQIAD